MANLTKTENGKQYFRLADTLEYLIKNDMRKEMLKASALDLSENEKGNLFIEKHLVGELLTLPEYREMECNVNTLINVK